MLKPSTQKTQTILLQSKYLHDFKNMVHIFCKTSGSIQFNSMQFVHPLFVRVNTIFSFVFSYQQLYSLAIDTLCFVSCPKITQKQDIQSNFTIKLKNHKNAKYIGLIYFNSGKLKDFTLDSKIKV